VSITTARGDSGYTDIRTGERLPKDHPRIECLGALDELCAFLGDAKCAVRPEHREIIAAVQGDLFTVMGIIAQPAPAEIPGAAHHDSNTAPNAQAGNSNTVSGGNSITVPDVGRVSKWIRELEAAHPMRGFTVPGSSSAEAKLHIARAVCRRCERRLVTLAHTAPADPALLRYMNRLSDLLFMLASGEELV
jgi:cob(I)alamin adenosyltransferase